MISVLFVCLGNICRSPMAEALFRHKLEQHGLIDRIEVDSAGTGRWHVGEPPHKGTQKILSQNGVSCKGMTARLLTSQDLKDFDYIIAMDESNLNNILKLSDGRKKVYRLLDFLENQPVRDVPDPYYTDNFDEVYRLVNAATEELLRFISDENNLTLH